MMVNVAPDPPLTEKALVFGRRWAERWPGYDPRYGGGAPEGSVYDHRHAHPDFRSPLSSDEEADASVEFHAAVIEWLADGRPVTLLTFDVESEWDGDYAYQVSALDGLLEREPLLSVIDEQHDDGTSVIHVFISTIGADDLRLPEVWAKTANGDAPVLVVGPEMQWLARPHVECVAVNTFVDADLESLREVERETWDRWGVPHDRVALLDLARVTAYFLGRRDTWRRAGVQVVTGPQYRVWRDGEFDHIADTLPADLSQTDWFLVGLESAAGEATVIVHDSGTCTVQLDRDTADEDSEMVFEYREHAGSLDFDGVVGVLERVVGTLAPSHPGRH